VLQKTVEITLFEAKSALVDPSLGMQQKFDGVYLSLITYDNKLYAHNKKGEVRDVPKFLQETFRNLKGYWQFRGELMGSKYYMFDILKADGKDLEMLTYAQRHFVLERMFQNNIPGCELVPLIKDRDNKEKYFEIFESSRVEGVVFRDILHHEDDAVYKYKFRKSVDCVIMDTIQSPSSYVLGVHDESGKLTECGKLSSFNLKGGKIGDVVEVSCLYVTLSNKLFQPGTARIRTDKSAEDCTIDQLYRYYTNKTPIPVTQEK
jgi:ATP-dependent DNA ligase